MDRVFIKKPGKKWEFIFFCKIETFTDEFGKVESRTIAGYKEEDLEDWVSATDYAALITLINKGE